MQIVSQADNLHEMSKPIFRENIINLSSAEFIHSTVSVKIGITFTWNRKDEVDEWSDEIWCCFRPKIISHQYWKQQAVGLSIYLDLELRLINEKDTYTDVKKEMLGKLLCWIQMF